MDKIVEMALAKVNEAVNAIPEKPEGADYSTIGKGYREAKSKADNAIALLQAAIDAV